MSQVVGLISRIKEDVSSDILQMINMALPNISYFYGIASPSQIETSNRKLESTSIKSEVALGYQMTKILNYDSPQPVIQENKAIAIVGRLWDTAYPDIIALADTLRESSYDLHHFVETHNGSYAVIVAQDDSITAVVDPIGVIPLYVGANIKKVGISTNPKYLLGLGLQPTKVQPGHKVKLGPEGVSLKRITEVKGSQICPTEDIINVLNENMIFSSRRMSKGLDRVAVAYSGGIDSTLVAYYLKEVGVKPYLVCVGIEGSEDFSAAMQGADFLGLPLILRVINKEEVSEAVEHLVNVLADATPIQVCIAAPLYFVASKSLELGLRVVFSGNGSDELFGGYAKYERLAKTDPKAARAEMVKDYTNSHVVNFQRDWITCATLGVELRMPFTDMYVSTFALGLPDNVVVPNVNDKRKKLLRLLATQINLPENIVNRPKKAAQYSTGFSKAFERLSRRCGKTPEGYIKSIRDRHRF